MLNQTGYFKNKWSNFLSKEQQSALQPECHNCHTFAFQAVELRNWWPWKLIYPLTPQVVPPGQAWGILVGQCGEVWGDYQWVSLSSYKVLHRAVLERDGSHGAALTVGHEQAAPGLLWGQGQPRGLGKPCLVWVSIVPVLLIPAPSKAKTHSFL